MPDYNFNFNKTEWSEDLINDRNQLDQQITEHILSGQSDLQPNDQQNFLQNKLYKYYEQQEAIRKANRGRTAHSYLRDNVYNNVVNPVEYSSEELTAARNRVAELQDQVNRLTAANNSRYVSEAYKSQNKAELENKQSALALAQQQQERMERDTARARQATQQRVVDEAAERGVSYKDQSEAYGQSLKEMYEQREQLMQQLKGLDKKYSRSNSDLDFETRRQMHEDEKESTTDRLEKLEREIARIEGTKSYAEKYLAKDASAKRVVEWGRELAKLADQQNSQLHEKAKEEQRQAINMTGGMAGLAYDANLRRTSKDAYRPTAQWTKDQEDLFYFYFGSPDFGPKVAEDYAARLNYAYNTGAINEKTKAAEAWGAGAGSSVPSKIGRGVAGIAGSIVSMPFAAADYMNKMLEVSANGRYAGRDFVMPNDYTEAVTMGRSEQLNKDYGEANLPIVGKKGLGDVYQLTQSMAQSLALGNLVGEAATLGAFFFQSANSSFDEAMRRGASAEYAALYSALCGTAEVAFEKISLDKLLTNKDWSKQLVKELASQGLVEGSEELFTSLANEMNERIAAAATGQRPQMEQKISALVAQGMTLKDAQHQVYSEFVSDLAWDAIGGAISGFGSGAVQAGVRGTQNKLWEMRRDSVLDKQSGAHVAGKDGKATGTKSSNATDAQLEKLLVQAEKRGDLQTALFIANELINREEAGQRQRPTGDPDSTSMLAERILDGMRRKAGVIQDGDGLGETPLNDDELPPPYEEERPPMPGDEEAPPEWASKRQEEPTVGEQRNGNEPPARSDREAPPEWRNGNTDLGSAQQKSSLDLELDEQLNEMRQRAIGPNQTTRDNRASLKVEVNNDVFDKYYSTYGFNYEKYCEDFAAGHPDLNPQSTGRDENALVDYLKKDTLRELDRSRQGSAYKLDTGYAERVEKNAKEKIAFLDGIKKALSEERNANVSHFNSTERRNAAILAAYLQSLARKIYDAKNVYNQSKTDANWDVVKSWQYAYATALDQYRTYWEGLQNAAGQQAAPAGQITQPSQQNAAQTVKPNDSEQQDHIPTWEEYKAQNNIFLQTGMKSEKQLRADYERMLKSVSTTSTESGTMSVPNTQEVTTNAGEQAVRTDEAAAGRPDGAVRESDVRSAGRTGSQNAGAQEATSAQQGEESRAYERSSELPGFVTEEDRTTLGTKEDSVNRDNLPPEKQTSFKRLLEQTAKGTRFITKPKIGSRVHFLQQLFKKLGVADDFLFARNDRTSVFKDGAVAKQQLGKVIIDVNSDFSVLLSKGVHDYFHKKIFDKLGGGTTQSILDGSYTKRLSLYKEVFSNALGEDRVQSLVKNAINTIKSFDNFRYGDKYAIEYNYIVAKVIQTIQSDPRYFNAYAKPLVAEMQDARALEEFFNYIVSWDLDYVDDIQNAMGLSDEELGALRKAALDVLSSDANGIVSADDAKAITEALVEWDDLNGTFTDDDYDETDWPGFSLAEDEFEDLGDPFIPTENAYGKERQRELAATLRTLISGDAEAIGRLSTDYLNYAINYTLKKSDPDLDFKEKRRTYNAIANVLSGMNIDTFGYDRNVARNESNDKNNAGFDGMMSKAPNKLFYAVSSRTQADNYEGGRRGMDTIGNLQPGQYRPTGNAADMQTVLRNAINELDRRGLNIWGKENSNRFEYDEETDDTGKQYERSDVDSDYSSQYNSATYGDSKPEDDYSDEYNEGSESRESKLRAKDQRVAEKREATSALRRLREGDNWLEGAVKVNPEAKEWGRGAKKTAGQKTQGWYDINRRSSLAEREFARQRVMNARAAEDLSFEIQTMEDQAADIREEVERARRNSPAAKESLKMIDGLLEDLNSDIDDLHAIDDMFRDAVREDPNSDMTKQLAAEGTRLASEIESLRRDIDTLGRLANESIVNNNSEELRDAEKRLRKQEQKIKTKREHLKKLLDESHGGDKSGALVASRAETAFDSMPDDVIKQIIRNGYVSMDMLQDYYGNADAAYQTMYEFQERVGETGKTRVPSVHKLTGLEKTALHGILADRKKAGKITSGYGGVETSENLPERSQNAPASMSKAEYTEAMQQEYGPYISDEQRKKPKSKSENDKRIPATVQPITNETISERNRRAYQSSKFNGGMVLEPTGPTPANMDRLNRMFADRLGIKNKGNTAIAYGKRVDAGTWEDDSGVLDITENANAKEEKKPLVVDAAYTNYAAAAQSVADLHKKILSDIMAEHPNAEPDFIDKQIEDSFLGNSVRALDTAVSQIANSKDPLGAVFNLRQQLYSAKNKGEGTYAALASDAVIGMCDEIGRLIENKTMPYDEKARAYAVATTQLVSALSTRAERLYDAAHRVQRIQDKLATVTKKDRGKLKEALTGYKIMQMNPTTLFKMLDNFDIGGKGAGYEIARALENGTVKSAELIARAARQFDEAKKTEGFQEFAEGKANARYKFKGEYTISELQAIEFILLARRMNGMKVYDVDAHGGVIEKTRLQTLKGFALRDADGNHIFVDSMYEVSPGKKKRFDWYKEAESMYRNLSPAAKAYLKAVNKVMDGLGKEIRQAKINATGVGFTGMEGTGYYPLSYMSDKEHLPDYNTKPDYEGLSHDKHLEGPRLTHGGYAVVQNAAPVVDRYVEWASNYAGFADIADMLQTMNVSGNGRGLVNATTDAYGAKYGKAIERYIGDVNNFTDVSREHTENSTLRALRQNMAAGVLGLSLSVPIKQVASYWDAAGILSMDSLRRAYRVKAFVKEKGLGADNMFLKSRQVGNVDPTISEMMGSGLMDNLKKRSNIVKLFAEATNRMDYKTVDNLFTATVLDVEANLPGIDKDSDLFKRAVESKFNQVVLNTQPIFNKNARSEYLRSSNEWQRLFSMFRTQQTQNFNRLIVTTMEARAAKGTSLETATKRQLRQTIAGQVAGQLEFAALTAIANFVMHGWKRWRDDDDEITVESVVKRFGLDALESIAGTAWFGDEIAKMLVDGAFGTNESFGVSMGVLSSVFDTLKYFTDIMGDVAKGNPLDIFDSTRKFVGAGASVLGLPVNNLYRLANAAVMWGADALKWASNGKYGNRANYDDSMKMLDAWIKGGLKEEGAKKQAAVAFRKDQPENLLYNLGILSSLTDEGKDDKGRNYLDSLIKKSGDSDAEESKNHRIVDYLVHQAVSADKIDKAVDQYGTSYQYNQFYDILRQNGHTPIQAVKKLDEIDVDGDNKITTDELQDYWKKHGHDPKENKLVEALFGPTADDFRIIKDTKTYETATRYYKPVVDSGVTAEKAVEIVDGCRSESGDVTQAGIYQYYLEHPEDIKQIQALYNSMGYKEKGQPRTWESFLKAQAKKAS